LRVELTAGDHGTNKPLNTPVHNVLQKEKFISQRGLSECTRVTDHGKRKGGKEKELLLGRVPAGRRSFVKKRIMPS